MCLKITISRIAGVMTAIGDTGFYAEYGDEKGTADMIRKALDSEDELGKKQERELKIYFQRQKE